MGVELNRGCWLVVRSDGGSSTYVVGARMIVNLSFQGPKAECVFVYVLS